MNRIAAKSTLAAVALALAGCGGSAEAAATTDCLAVPPEVITAIAGGAPEGSGFIAHEAAAVVGDAGEVYFVAMRFDALGETDMVGVWTTTSITANAANSVLGVDGFATQFTGWPDAEQVLGMSRVHPPAMEAKDCLG